MNKMENVELICLKLQGLTKLNFQIHLGYVLSEFYRYKGLTYEMPSPNGGDDKNDGWVEEEALFYQVYAPSQLREGLEKSMKKKFEEDLRGLIINIKIGKWNGIINKFIFIVNTFDDHLPKDSDRFYHNLVEKVKEESGYDFNHEVCNLMYVKRLLMQVDDIEIFDLMKSHLNLTSRLPAGTITNQTIYLFLTRLGFKIMESTITPSFTDYDRISTDKKIEINNLNDSKTEIDQIISNLAVIEEAVNSLNQNIKTSELFDKVVQFVISVYNLLSREYTGVELFNKVCEAVAKNCEDTMVTNIPAKFLVVYVFDKCDIFEKEEMSYASPE